MLSREMVSDTLQSWAGNHPLSTQLLHLLYASALPIVLEFFLVLEIYFLSFLEGFLELGFCQKIIKIQGTIVQQR